VGPAAFPQRQTIPGQPTPAALQSRVNGVFAENFSIPGAIIKSAELVPARPGAQPFQLRGLIAGRAGLEPTGALLRPISARRLEVCCEPMWPPEALLSKPISTALAEV